MREVAALSGTSLKTVSRVFNGVSTVDENLSRRVKVAARKLNYTPNMTAGSLRRKNGQTKTIGLLLEDISNPFSSALHRVFENYARERGFIVLAGSLDEDADRELELVSLFISRRVDGLIIAPAGSDQGYLKPEVQAGTKFGFIDRPPMNFTADSVVSTNREGSRRAVAHLASFGHTRIAYLGDQSTIYTASERYQGYLEGMKQAKIPVDKKLVFQGFDSPETVKASVIALFESSNSPTAIYASQNLVTLAVIQALREMGREKKIALVGFDHIPAAELLTPAITLITQDIAAMGQHSAQLLFNRIEGFEGSAVQDIIPTSLIVRGSGEIRPSR